jgi:hypothetical protein
MTSNYSFGFSDNKIEQFYADKSDCKIETNLFNCTDEKKLSWHLTGINGGWRIGSICNLNTSPKYQKYIYLKYYIIKQTIAQDTKSRTSSTLIQTSTKVIRTSFLQNTSISFTKNNSVSIAFLSRFSSSNKSLFNLSNLSIKSNISLKYILNLGFQTFYNFSYSHVTTYNELKNIYLTCKRETILCASGSFSYSSYLSLISCGLCYDILTPSSFNQPKFVNNAYWYFTDTYSFGFSPSANIKQNWADQSDCELNALNSFTCTDKYKLSWHLHSNLGGFRLGSIANLNNSTEFRKLIFLY